MKLKGLNGPRFDRKGFICVQNRCRISTASVFTIFKIKKSGGDEIYGRILMNSEELEGPNVDLRSRKEETYKCRIAAEGRRVFSGQTRLMQRPELVRMRRPAAAAAMELERENSGERRKTSGWRLNGPGYL